MIPLNILIVEDEMISAMSIETMVTSLGYKVAGIVDTGEEVINRIREIKPDLILMDIILKGKMDGIETSEKLKEFYNVPVVYLTACTDELTFQRAKLTAPFGYIIKPFDERLLHITIQVALYKHEMEEKLREKAIKKEKEKYRVNIEGIFTSVHDGIIALDNELNITELNPAVRDILGFSREDIGKSFEKLVKECNCNKCVKIARDTIIQKKPQKIEFTECINTSIKVITISTSSLIDTNGIFSGVVMVIRDETKYYALEKELTERKSFAGIVGKSKDMQDIYSLLETLPDVSSNVLITGESGTGKELVAEALHYKGVRSKYPLVKMNCAALSPGLLESELFGHVKGAFTGAIHDKIGRFQVADRGTIFLDEISDISPSTQIALLRVLQEREFERVGDSKTIRVNVRVIAATNRDLREKVRKGQFREDLYYRLKVMEIKLPPLRKRKEDIPLLTDFFIKQYNMEFKRNITGLSSDVQRVFMDYSWPGNIRELKNTIEHAFVVCRKSIITLEDLPAELKHIPPSIVSYRNDEKLTIIEVLEKVRWNKSKAADILGVSRQTIYRKIREYGL
ncbi:MAG: sigma 54-interacting transcriptional regulator [Candidatus Eremiobacterota bacterium]